MSLYIDIRVNNKIVATAAVQNVSGDDICDYLGAARTAAFGGRRDYHHGILIKNHDRRTTVWSLVEKICAELAAKESRQ
ncbi:MAG: hypothetical protein P4L76_13340 [Beijerinckiaceae bacterium]|nr:hypothetical protein [Beijerinckiaceae bacterium]